MKIRDLDKLTKGDVLVFTKISGRFSNEYKIGDELIFSKFTKLEPTSASHLELLRMEGNRAYSVGFTTAMCKYLETKQTIRNRKLTEILK